MKMFKIHYFHLKMVLNIYIQWTEEHLSGKPLENVTWEELRSYIRYLKEIRGLNSRTVNVHIAQLRDFYYYVLHRDWDRREVPFLRFDEHLPAVPSRDQVLSIIASLENPKHRAEVALLYSSGIRVSELVGINIGDIDFSINGFMVTRKGGNQAILYFPDEVAQVLKDYLKLRKEITPQPGHEDALFLSLQNRRISVRAVQLMVKKYTALAAPLKKYLSPHKLRSTFGTNLYRETGDIYLVADVLGHSDVNTTRKHYAAMSDDRRRMAARKVHLRTDPEEESDQE